MCKNLNIFNVATIKVNHKNSEVLVKKTVEPSEKYGKVDTYMMYLPTTEKDIYRVAVAIFNNKHEIPYANIFVVNTKKKEKTYVGVPSENQRRNIKSLIDSYETERKFKLLKTKCKEKAPCFIDYKPLPEDMVFNKKWDVVAESTSFGKTEIIAQFDSQEEACNYCNDLGNYIIDNATAEPWELRVAYHGNCDTKYNVMMCTNGLKMTTYASFDSEEEAVKLCEELHWEFKDEHDFVWNLEIEEVA